MQTETSSESKKTNATSCSTCARRCPFRKAAGGTDSRRYINTASLIGRVFTQDFWTTLLGREVEIDHDGMTSRGILRLRVADWLLLLSEGGLPWLMDGSDGVAVTCLEGPWPEFPKTLKGRDAGGVLSLADIFEQCRGRRCEIRFPDGRREFGIPTEFETSVDLVVEPADGTPGCSVCIATLREDGSLDFLAAENLSGGRLRRTIDLDLASCVRR